MKAYFAILRWFIRTFLLSWLCDDLLVDPGIVGYWTGEETLEEGLTAHTGHVGPDGADPPHHHQHHQQQEEDPQSHQRGVMRDCLLPSGGSMR